MPARVLTNDFSWSKSRHEKFRECLRAYYFYYYRSWGGWERAAHPEVKELYLLKKLSNRYTWAGSAVHDAIRDVLMDLRAGRAVDEGQVLTRVRTQMREDFCHSRGQAYRQFKIRKSFSGLVEHEYTEPVGPEEWKRNWDAVEQALTWFFASRWMALGRTLKAHQWLEVDEGALNSNFELEGVRVFAVPDFAYIEEDGTPVVVDWKTGKSREGYDEQVLGYAVYLAQRYRLPLERIRASLVYLNEGKETDVRISADAAQSFGAYFAKSVDGMRELLAHPAENKPLPEEAFPPTEDRARCSRCVFRRTCGRDVAHAAPMLAPGAMPGVSPQPAVGAQ